MKKILMAGAALIMSASNVQAQGITLSSAAASPGASTDVVAKYAAEIAAANNIATIQVQVGQVLTKTIVQVAKGETDISATAFILSFLMSKGLGPYSGMGKEKGKALAANTRLLYPYHLAAFCLVSFKSTGIDSYEKIKGKTIHNGPPRGGALVTARNVIRLATGGFKEGRDYKGKQIAWGQANSIFLDRSVDAAVRPCGNPSSYIPVMAAAGKINIVSVPKKMYEGKGFQKYIKAPGMGPIEWSVNEMNVYGPNVKIISDDNIFRSAANTGGTVVNKKMDKKLARALTAAFIKNIKLLFQKASFMKYHFAGNVDDKIHGVCKVGVKYHPGAVEAWEEAGFKIPACAKS
jgi:hypothetical protein